MLAVWRFLQVFYKLLPQSVYLQDVGQSILEIYSRVLESLAYNVIARIDVLIFVDDTVKKSVAEEHFSIIPPVSRHSNKIVSTPFSLHLTSSPPYATPFATPTPQSSPRGHLFPLLLPAELEISMIFFLRTEAYISFPVVRRKLEMPTSTSMIMSL